jgi:hypothetical protein
MVPLTRVACLDPIKALNCSDSFFPYLCIFQDLEVNRMIGMGLEDGGLYFLDLAPISPA